MTDHDDRIDFSLLEVPSLDGLVLDIEARCAPLLELRRARPTTMQLAAWWRPAIAAAVVIGVASTVMLLREPMPPRGPATPDFAGRALAPVPSQVAMMLGVPTPLASRLTSARPPTLAELVPESTR